MTDWKALCAELTHEVEQYAEDRGDLMPECADRARAALAEPVAKAPTDEELLELTEDWPATTGPRHDLSGCPEVPLYSVFADEVVDFARAALARWGHHPAPPAAGEVGELVEFLRDWGDDYADEGTKWHRAADLLEQRHPAPVPVAERLPGPEDCDGEGRCWVHQPHEACPESPAWELMLAKYASTNYGAVCWLPATALPLPAGGGGVMDERLRKDRPWSEYPIGTKAHSVGGGYWTRVEQGWEWFAGGTFPTPGGDAVGRCIELPQGEVG